MFNAVIEFIQEYYQTKEAIALHAPYFGGNEQQYVAEAINSTFVSSVGNFVQTFEQNIAAYTNSPGSVVTVNGTSALHMALIVAQVEPKDYVITQALTFVATGNAIRYCQADPIFIDVDKKTLSMCPKALTQWLDEYAYLDYHNQCRYRKNNRRIQACVPMHTFGHPAYMNALLAVCKHWNITVVEDAAESLGSLYQGKHTGTLGTLGILSFNGNKIITTGGGGMILTNLNLAKRAKHLTTTAKVSHDYEYFHDELGYNYRMPNLNAALGCAQLEQLESFIDSKRALAKQYQDLFLNTDLEFVVEPADCRSNYWLNAVICKDQVHRDALLQSTNQVKVMTRPIWQTLNQLPIFMDVPQDNLAMTGWLAKRVVNLPSSVRKI